MAAAAATVQRQYQLQHYIQLYEAGHRGWRHKPQQQQQEQYKANTSTTTSSSNGNGNASTSSMSTSSSATSSGLCMHGSVRACAAACNSTAARRNLLPVILHVMILSSSLCCCCCSRTTCSPPFCGGRATCIHPCCFCAAAAAAAQAPDPSSALASAAGAEARMAELEVKVGRVSWLPLAIPSHLGCYLFHPSPQLLVFWPLPLPACVCLPCPPFARPSPLGLLHRVHPPDYSSHLPPPSF
jgi:hypothetical protein